MSLLVRDVGGPHEEVLAHWSREGLGREVVSDYRGGVSAVRLGLLARFGVLDNSLREVFKYVEYWREAEDIATLGT